MYKLETINISNFNYINKFNITKEYRDELFEICSNKNIFKKFLLGKNIKFIKTNKQYIGFMWFSKIHYQNYKIHCIRILPEYDSPIHYKNLFKFFSINSAITIGYNNNLQKDILINEGFRVSKTIVEMKKEFNKLDLFKDYPSEITFRIFRDGLDEKQRCNIQNEVFNSVNRQSIDEDDIHYEKYQSHYIPSGCVFINNGINDIGYGQLIKKDDKIYIANFGILKNYRGHGYGNLLLKYLLEIGKNLNVKEIYLRCDKSNVEALNLYLSNGFEIINTYYEYEYQKKEIKE